MTSEGSYETLEKIGHGSFGVIRKVRRRTDGFIMCRKEISYSKMSQKEREQLHAEFQILSTLRHPHIVAYYHREHLKSSQDLHLYMEYCGNGDLGKVINDLKSTGQHAQESFVWSIFSQLTLALYRCHYGADPPEVGADVLGLTKGTAPSKAPAGTVIVLHRDLKPENIFLGEDNSVKLGDFGLSKMIKSHDFASTYVGTPFYMSPEICAAEKYTQKSDIWSLGCIIYELCTREPPFNAKSHFQLVQKIKEGKVKPLPDIYSPELSAVIKDCLRVNADRRPETASLINLPVVKLMRKEKEVVDFNKMLKIKEDALRQREREVKDRLSNLEREREIIRIELDSSLRREWEVKARLEIDRRVNTEIEQLHKRFEEEVQSRVQLELQTRTIPQAERPPRIDEPLILGFKAEPKSDFPDSSAGVSGDEFPSSTDLTEYSIDSPDTSRELKRPTARTPFDRAQTMFVGHASTPMDVEMASPSPMAIASLSLSPRRNEQTKAPSAKPGNIFTVNARQNAGAVLAHPKWELPPEPTLVDSDEDDTIPSPTRQIKSSKNPFTSKTRPVLVSQKTCPVNRLRTKISNSGFVSKQAVPLPDLPTNRSPSPNRRLSKIPSAPLMQVEHSNNSTPSLLTRKGSLKRAETTGSVPSSDTENLGKVAAKNNIKGRTLVELQQARAGGRPMSAVIPPPHSRPPSSSSGGENVNTSPKRGVRLGERRASSSSGSNSGSGLGALNDSGVAVWDPERDEMPSPFLVRQRKINRI